MTPSEWQIQSVGDFNGDDKSDTLWRDTSGIIAIWRMNGTTIVSGGAVAVMPTEWQIMN